MTKKHHKTNSFQKKLSPKEKQVLCTFKKLNKLSISSVNTIEDTAVMEKITDQIDNCNKILKYLKQKKQNIIIAQKKYFKNSQIVHGTNLSESSEKDFNSSDLNSTSPTQQLSNNSNTCNIKRSEPETVEPIETVEKVVKNKKYSRSRSRPVKLPEKSPEMREINENVDNYSYFQGISGKTFDLGSLVNPKEILKKQKISAADQLLLIYQLTYKGCDSKLGSTDFWREVYKTYRKCFNNLSMASVIRHWYQIRSHGCYNEFVALIHKFKPVLDNYDLK